MTTTIGRLIAFTLGIRTVQVLLRTVGFSSTVRLLERLPVSTTEGDLPDPDRWVAEIKMVSRPPRRPSCLDRSVLLWFITQIYDLDVSLRIGVAPSSNGVDGHAWVEIDGAVKIRTRVTEVVEQQRRLLAETRAVAAEVEHRQVVLVGAHTLDPMARRLLDVGKRRRRRGLFRHGPVRQPPLIRSAGRPIRRKVADSVRGFRLGGQAGRIDQEQNQSRKSRFWRHPCTPCRFC